MAGEKITAVPLDPAAYAPYGEVIAAANPSAEANQGTAMRTLKAELKNLRPETARPSLSVYRCQPAPPGAFAAKLLERHAFSTQAFVAMAAAKGFLALVALGGDAPDLSTLKAFVVGPDQGVTYRPGVWHHPMVVLGQETDMACWVCEDGTAADCEVFELDPPIEVEIP